MHTSTKTNGILWVGDPHVSTRNIGRRKDDFLTSVLDKLSACADLCIDKGLTAVILGDLFHRNGDNNLRMLNRLVRVLQRFPSPPIVLEGNHDKEKTALSDEDALQLLQQTGVVRVATVAGLFETFDIHGEVVNLWMVPHGSEIPDALPELHEGVNVMVTHHDMAFGSAYPGSQPLKPIAGIDMVVNGHMHDTKKSVLMDNTWWHNPGNIEPLSVDLMAHEPRAWEWSPAMGTAVLQAHVLPHGTDLFDLTGLQVEAADAHASVAKVVEVSAFALELSQDSALEAEKSDDATMLREDLEAVMSAAAATPAAQTLLRGLAQRLSAPTP